MAKVLVVDDEPNIVLSLEFLMEQAGFEVVTAEDGEQALARVNDSHPDLLLLDISLPGISGFDVLERLRGEAATAQLPIIMLTAHGRDVEREKGMALGADDYITKPFSTQSLVEKVKALLIEEQP
ncbi:response regulator [Halomonas sp. ISL-60]|uniref:response regulator transcription factor n=1 Tax=unclassified Halomonas TaxID=2609666 RepID=UPI0007D9DDE5|nr:MULTISPECIES: response regulator [unclassified Halomonas]MBT2774376.1 response regulator [Halomonas sp. ISL-60]MBT2788124.1 response regulator [Halomonas sp. ISL-106]MBT2795873.1 response regulator [Halomonas sp. ISL-104]MBT2802163.1 response regulator [Halomonas sp. ISL-56]OAL61156.1 two-component system response regulator [Halomonas sp. ALS9]